jgi:hypothetical protein
VTTETNNDSTVLEIVGNLIEATRNIANSIEVIHRRLDLLEDTADDPIMDDMVQSATDAVIRAMLPEHTAEDEMRLALEEQGVVFADGKGASWGVEPAPDDDEPDFLSTEDLLEQKFLAWVHDGGPLDPSDQADMVEYLYNLADRDEAADIVGALVDARAHAQRLGNDLAEVGRRLTEYERSNANLRARIEQLLDERDSYEDSWRHVAARTQSEAHREELDVAREIISPHLEDDGRGREERVDPLTDERGEPIVPF